MKKVKLARLPHRVPVKMQVTLPPDLAARLRDYADLYAETYGVREERAELVPYMLNAFLNSDAEFRMSYPTSLRPKPFMICANAVPILPVPTGLAG